jgi:hypothetical protein
MGSIQKTKVIYFMEIVSNGFKTYLFVCLFFNQSATKSKSKPVAATPKPKPKPTPRKTPANRGRGRGGRSNKVESDDEPFRSNVSVKKIKVKELKRKR